MDIPGAASKFVELFMLLCYTMLVNLCYTVLVILCIEVIIIKSHFGKVFGICAGVTGGVLLGVFVHPAFWALLPIGVCVGFAIDLRAAKGKQ